MSFSLKWLKFYFIGHTELSLKLNVDESTYRFLEGAIKKFWGLLANLFLDIELMKLRPNQFYLDVCTCL